MIACLVFDIDDTLYLERDYVRSGFAAVDGWLGDRRGLMGFFELAWAHFLAGRRGDIFDLVLTELGLQPHPGTIERLVRVYREHTPSIELLPDAAACLSRLEGSVVLAALSDGPPAAQRAKVRALGLDSRLSPVLITGAMGERFAKPSPEGFRLIEAKIGRGGSRCAYVADNPGKDFTGPRSLGWKTIRIRRGGGLHTARPSDEDVDAEISTLDDLETVLHLPGSPTVRAGSRPAWRP